MAKGIKPSIVAADRNYDDRENDYYLQLLGISFAVRLNDYRARRRTRTGGRIELKASREYQEGLKERYKGGVETEAG